MQLGPVRTATPHLGDDPAFPYPLPFPGNQLPVMRVSTQKVFIMFDDNKPSVAAKSTPGVNNLAGRRRTHGITGFSSDINPFFTRTFSIVFTDKPPIDRPGPEHAPAGGRQGPGGNRGLRPDPALGRRYRFGPGWGVVRFWLAGSRSRPGRPGRRLFSFYGWRTESQRLTLEDGVGLVQMIPGNQLVHAVAVEKGDRVQAVTVPYTMAVRMPDWPLAVITDRCFYRFRSAGRQQAPYQQPDPAGRALSCE